MHVNLCVNIQIETQAQAHGAKVTLGREGAVCVNAIGHCKHSTQTEVEQQHMQQIFKFQKNDHWYQSHSPFCFS